MDELFKNIEEYSSKKKNKIKDNSINILDKLMEENEINQ